MSIHHATPTILFCAFGMVGCLPADTRPEPSRVYATVDLVSDLREDEAEANPIVFATDDGWTVTLKRLIVSMGVLELAGDKDKCNSYADARYDRVLDVAQPGPQKLGQVWGLNACLIGYSVLKGRDQSVLGSAVTADDLALMQNAVVPVSSPTGVTTDQGMALHVQGYAEKSSSHVDFDWGFSDRLDWTDCQRMVDGKLESQLPLVSGDTIDVNIAIDPRNLFKVALPLAGPPTFPPDMTGAAALMTLIANADQVSGNANGHVSIDELYAVASPAGFIESNLAELLRARAYPSLFQYSDGQCALASSEGRRGGRF